MTLLLLTLPFFALGLLTGRLAVAVAAPAIVAAWYAGLVSGAWGDGIGDGWPAALAATAAVGAAQALAGVAARRAMSSRPWRAGGRRRRPPAERRV